MVSLLKRLMMGATAVIGFATSSYAAPVPASWTDTVDYATRVGNSFFYTHDISDDGFSPWAGDRVTNFTLAIDLYDDYDLSSERARIHVGLEGTDVVGDEFGTRTFITSWNNVILSGVWQLNTFGGLLVWIESLRGDFNFGGSTLVANGYTRSAVPEPGTIALLGLGMLGIGLGRRKLAK